MSGRFTCLWVSYGGHGDAAQDSLAGFYCAVFDTNIGEAQAPKTPERNLYVLNDAEHDQWCAYSSEPEWRSKVDLPGMEASTVARVEYSGGRISSIYLTTEDDPGVGDWTVFDLYSLDKSEKLRSLKRTINVIPGRVRELQMWSIQNGKSVRQATQDPETLKPLPPTHEWVPDLPVLASLSDFPFWPLIQNEGRVALTKGEACITVRLWPPAPPAPSVPVKLWKTFVDRFGWIIDYPSTWKAESTCPTGCPGETVGFSNPATGGYVRVSSLVDQLGGKSVQDRLAELSRTRNVNPRISETAIVLDSHPALTVRYLQPELEMESTYVLNDSASFTIEIQAVHWKIEQLTDYPADLLPGN